MSSNRCFCVKANMQKSSQPFADGRQWGFELAGRRYVKVGVSSDTVALISDAPFQSRARPEQWINKDFFRVEKGSRPSGRRAAITILEDRPGFGKCGLEAGGCACRRAGG